MVIAPDLTMAAEIIADIATYMAIQKATGWNRYEVKVPLIDRQVERDWLFGGILLQFEVEQITLT